MNPLLRLKDYGQSVWYDNIDRGMLRTGTLARMIKEDGLRGITSNPTIFEKAISGSSDYDASIRSLLHTHRPDARELFFSVAIEDIQVAADLLRPVYDASAGRDGMVSLEVSPDLAYNTEATVNEAEQLHARVNRPNVMIKVPGTRPGVEAFEALIGKGLNVNVTLLFSVERYKEIVEAYFIGLETRLRRGLPLSGIASVASFFVSRVDTAMDKLLEERKDGAQGQLAQSLFGKIAIANAKLAYQWYQRTHSSPRFEALRQAGAGPQRLLWASTGTKNPQYSDVLYVDGLIGPDTVNTMPPATYNAYKDHGKPQAATLTQDLEVAQQQIKAIKDLGIELAEITQRLEDEGVQSFSKSFANLITGIANKVQALNGRRATA